MARNYARENMQLSRFGVLVAQLESIVASAAHKPPDALLCFDLLSDLISAIEEEPKESVLQWQRKCEDTLYSLLVLGARRPVRHLASEAMANIILKGDSISIYSRASSLQGFLSDGKRSEAQKVAGACQCLGILYRYFGRRIVSGLLEATNTVSKLLKFNEELELNLIEEETAKRVAEEIRKKVEESLNSEEINLEIERRLEEGRKKLVAEVAAQLEKEKESAVIEARKSDASIYSYVV